MVKRWRSVALAAVVLAACTGAGTANPATSSAPTTVDDDGQPDAVATTVSGPVDERLDELPDPSETQVVNTSFGRWTWTRHDTDVTTLDREYPFPDYPESEGLLPEGPWLGFDYRWRTVRGVGIPRGDGMGADRLRAVYRDAA